MPAATLISVEEFERLPGPEDGYLELVEGEVVFLSTPDFTHNRIQDNLVQLLKALLRTEGFCSAEQPFSGKGTSRLRADVGFTRWERVPKSGVVQGSPDFVVEIDSPSNREREMVRKRRICFDSGCAEFWTVFPDERFVGVERGGAFVDYWPGQSVVVPFSDGGAIAVEAIFEGIDEDAD